MVERLGQLAGNLLQASIQNTDYPVAEFSDLLHYLHTHELPSPEQQEKNFCQVLGDWVAGYMLKSTVITPRGLHNNLKHLKRTDSVMNKLGLQNRAELIAYAVRAGIANGENIPKRSLKNDVS